MHTIAMALRIERACTVKSQWHESLLLQAANFLANPLFFPWNKQKSSDGIVFGSEVRRCNLLLVQGLYICLYDLYYLYDLYVCVILTALPSLRQGDQEAAQVLLDAGADAAATDSLGRAASDMIKVIPLHMISGTVWHVGFDDLRSILVHELMFFAFFFSFCSPL